MHYLITAEQRKATHSSLFFEFQIGTFCNRHWLPDSVYLHADLFDSLGMYDLFRKSIPEFDYYYVTQVSPHQYAVLKRNADAYGAEVSALFAELDGWVTQCFRSEACFTICGI